MGVARLRRGAAGMVGLVKRPVAPGEGCEIGGEEGGEVGREGRAKELWSLAMNALCWCASPSSPRPSLPRRPPPAQKQARAAPRRPRRLAAARRTGQGGTQGRSRKAPVRAQGRLPALCAHRPVPATLAVGQDNRPISPGAQPHQLPPIIATSWTTNRLKKLWTATVSYLGLGKLRPND